MRWGTWARLAALGLATGELGSTGACNFPGGLHIPAGSSAGRTDQLISVLPKIPPHLGLGPAQFAALVAVVLLLFVLLAVVAIYVSSLCRFVLFDSVLTGHYRIRPSWRRWQRQGERLFFFNLVLTVASMSIMALIIGVPVAVAVLHGWFRGRGFAPVLLLFFLVGTVAVCFALIFLLIHVLTKDFVVPQMAFEQLGPVAGWRRLLAMMDRERGGYAGYLGMKAVLAMASAIVFGIASFVAILILMIPVILFAVIVVLLTPGHAAWVWNPYTVTLVVIAGCAAFALLTFLIAFLYAPATAFFTAYSMQFFAPRYPALAAALYPPPPALPGPPVVVT